MRRPWIAQGAPCENSRLPEDARQEANRRVGRSRDHLPARATNKGHIKGADFLNHLVLPNFYFHVTAAYAILRHCGVDLGKRDFLGAIPIRRS